MECVNKREMEVEVCFCKSFNFADPEGMKFLCCLLPAFGPSF